MSSRAAHKPFGLNRNCWTKGGSSLCCSLQCNVLYGGLVRYDRKRGNHPSIRLAGAMPFLAGGQGTVISG